MKCPNCNGLNTYILETRQKNKTRKRRYECRDCNSRFTTLEGYANSVLFSDGIGVSEEHLKVVSKQMLEGAAELTALAKIFGRKNGE